MMLSGTDRPTYTGSVGRPVVTDEPSARESDDDDEDDIFTRTTLTFLISFPPTNRIRSHTLKTPPLKMLILDTLRPTSHTAVGAGGEVASPPETVVEAGAISFAMITWGCPGFTNEGG